MRKTKIICTIGPASENEPMLRKLIENGMNVARLNFSHADHEEHKKRIDLIKKMRAEYKTHIAILLDTKGPEIRVGSFKDGSAELCEGDVFKLCTGSVQGDNTCVSVSHENLREDVKAGTRILLDDGLIELSAEKVENDGVVCRIKNGGLIKNNKAVNIPGAELKMDYVSKKDEEDILFGIKNDVDYIAASFCRSSEDVLAIRKILENNGGKCIQIIAKIENQKGVDNIDEILNVADGIMVARGDMGVEMDIVELPRIQKMLIKKAYSARKKVITATQMLDSMINNPRPTRAEATDVANAVYDGTSAIMLSGETAVGKYPLESLITMSNIAIKTEENIRYANRFNNTLPEFSTSVTSAISQATCSAAHSLRASAVIAFTQSGRTARAVSSFRPAVPIIACSPSEKTCNQLALSWGVYPMLAHQQESSDKMFEHAVQLAESAGLVEHGEVVVITAGVPIGISGTTNMIQVQIVGNVLVKGIGVTNISVNGKLCVCENEKELREKFEEGDIIVIPKTINSMMDILKKSSGIITEQGGVESHAAIVGLTLGIPVLCDAQGAMQILRHGTAVSLDTVRGLVYTGIQK